MNLIILHDVLPLPQLFWLRLHIDSTKCSEAGEINVF